MWWIYALLSAVFASLTAVFAKIGITNVNSNLATAIRSVVILLVAWGIVIGRGELKGLATLLSSGLRRRTMFRVAYTGWSEEFLRWGGISMGYNGIKLLNYVL